VVKRKREEKTLEKNEEKLKMKNLFFLLHFVSLIFFSQFQGNSGGREGRRRIKNKAQTCVQKQKRRRQ